jgi:type II secretion system protein N
MTAPSHASPGPRPAKDGPRLPRWLLALGVPLAGLLLVAFFVFLQFPFGRFREVLAAQTGGALGADVTIGALDPALTVGGPGFVARDVRVRWPGGDHASVDEASLRPAWSSSWLMGSPAFRLQADSDVGAIAGTLTVGAVPGFDGELSGVALARLPIERFAQGVSLDGDLDLEADLSFRDGMPVGQTHFVAHGGSLAAPQLPIALPYQELHGRLAFGEDGSVTLDDVALDGPMLSARLSGGTQPGPSLWLAPLALDLHLQVVDRNLLPTLRSSGLRLGPDGSADLRVRGNLAAPVVR